MSWLASWNPSIGRARLFEVREVKSTSLESDRTVLRARARYAAAIAASCLCHAIVILLALYIDRSWARISPPPVEEDIRVTLIEVPPLGSGGKSTPLLSPRIALPEHLSHHHKTVARRNTFHDSLRLRPPAENLASKVAAPRPLEPATSETVTASLNGAGSSGAATEGGGVPEGIPGGLGNSAANADQAVVPPVVVERTDPVYPIQARLNEIEGDVVLEVVIDEQGNMVGPIRVEKSIPLLDNAAIEALKQWRFAPARDRNGKPLRVILDVPLRFVLE
jgi:periplasmic protein TonB